MNSIPAKASVLRARWVFDIKRNSDLTIARYKARLVADSSKQQVDDVNSVYSPVGKYVSLRCLLALAALFDMEIYYLDFTTAFLNGVLEDDIYLYAPDGIRQKAKYLKLKKAIYGLRQASAEWFKLIVKRLKELKYKPINSDESVMVRHKDGKVSLCWLYVDEIMLFTMKGHQHLLNEAYKYLKSYTR